MKTEVKALQNRGCWRVFQTPAGVRLKIQNLYTNLREIGQERLSNGSQDWLFWGAYNEKALTTMKRLPL